MTEMHNAYLREYALRWLNIKPNPPDYLRMTNQ
jgi:hypothetical protein